MASKKLLGGALGKLDASDARDTDPVPHVIPLDPSTLDTPPLLYMSDDPAVPTLLPAVLFVAACELAGPENPRKDRGGATCPPVLLRFRPCT